MIGDDVADAATIQVVDKFYAVGNAAEKAKDQADFVAESGYTAGVQEILASLNANN
ncbi:TPA: hypothetical protein DF272_05045 [Candidatus Falkowbacteria bacterium]|nr:hypothetical protein [Candidatus Falkowbacteria bacterium]